MTGDEDDGDSDARVSQLALQVETVDLPPSQRMRTVTSPISAVLGWTHAHRRRHQ